MRTNRRRLLGLAAAICVVPLGRGAQPGDAMLRVGWLGTNNWDNARVAVTAFREAMRDLGWIEEKNFRIVGRFAEGHVDRLPALARELVQLRVHIIVSGSSAATRAARDVTKSIPIVMAASADAVAEGFVSSLARPGGNITGMTFLAGTEVAGKQLELLKQLTPAASRIAVLSNPANAAHGAFARDLKSAAPALGAELQLVETRSPNEIPQAFAAIRRARADAVLVLTDSLFFGQRQSIVALAASNSIPAMYSQREFVDAGGLFSYGPNLSDMFRRAATHVDKILKGAKPGDLPVEQPTRFELVVNLRTARALGLSVPQSVLVRADEMIE